MAHALSDELIARAKALAPAFQERASRNDRAAIYPEENFKDLIAHDLMRSAVPVSHGGYGFSVSNNDPLPQWLLTSAVALGDMSTARVFEAHVNNTDVLNRFGEEGVKKRIFAGIVAGTVRMAGWATEATQADTQDVSQRFSNQTTVRRGDGGWILSGAKTYATGAGGATHSIVSALNVDDKSSDPLERQQWFLIDTSDPGFSIDPRWWNPLGMRGSVSHRVLFDNLFLPDDHRVVSTAELVRHHWQARVIPHFVGTFLGGASAAFDFAQAYVRTRRTTEDPYVQHHIANMRIAIEIGYEILAKTARTWREGSLDEAGVMSNICRIAGERQALDVLGHATRACGATALFAPRPLERIWRDLEIYVRHENADRLLATVGRATLGIDADLSYARTA